MFNQILAPLLKQKTEYLKLKKKVIQTPLEKSNNIIIKGIDQDINKIIILNQFDCIM
jgi:hypothetical protein